ncbi:TIF1A-like protein [Mya arenaria]|uniref:TIF1A-like protein n=1 Tax=Mya arenaria TaxID=6604 RepID=A0ABY7DUA7_MYAAR|nr:TIF1A-like protein [Mya arenaria]
MAGVESIYCDLCVQDNNNIQAVAFCKNCTEFFCDTCARFHLRQALAKTHTVLRGKDLPKDSSLIKRKQILVDYCEKGHTDELLKYFCKNCNTLACSMCILNAHKECSKVECLQDLTNDELDKEYGDFISMSKDMERSIHNYHNKVNANRLLINQYHKSAMHGMQKDETGLLEQVGAASESALQDVDKIKTRKWEALDKLTEKHKYLEKRISMFKERIASRSTADKKAQLFIQIFRLEKQLDTIQKETSSLLKEIDTDAFRYIPKTDDTNLTKAGDVVDITIQTTSTF